MNNLKNGCLKNIDFIFGEQKKKKQQTPKKDIILKGGQFSWIKKKNQPDFLPGCLIQSVK